MGSERENLAKTLLRYGCNLWNIFTVKIGLPTTLMQDTRALFPGAVGFDDLNSWNWRTSAMRMNNLAYLKLKTITVAYNLPQILCSKIKMQSIRVYASGQDLLTISKDTWNRSFNPEESWERTDEQTYPFSSVVSMGIDIKF